MVSRGGPIQSVIHTFPYLGRGVIVALAVVSVITTELSVSTTWSAASSVGSSAEVVNRAQKGDRLPLAPALHRNTVNLPLNGHMPRQAKSA